MENILRNRAIMSAWLVLLGLMLFWAYSPTLKAPFYLDSTRHISGAYHRHLSTLDFSSLNQAMRIDYGDRIDRPVSALSFALNWYLTGDDPGWFRLVNVALHLGSAWAFFFMLISIFRVERVRERHRFIADTPLFTAGLAATLWALHPIHTGAVSYAVQRMTVLEGLFAFLCVGSFVRARMRVGATRWVWAWLCFACLLLAYGSKETAVTLIPILCATEMLLFSGLSWDKAKKPALLMVAACAVFLVVRSDFVVEAWRYLHGIREFTPWERFMTQWRLQFWYLFLLIFPDPRILQFDASITLSRGLFDPVTTILALAAIVGGLYMALKVAGRHPLVALGVWWFFLAQAVESTIFPLELYFEHRLYVPSTFLFVGAGWALMRATRSLRPTVSVLIFTCAFLGLAFASYSRNIVWGNPILFAEDNIRKAPDKERPYSFAALLYADLSKGLEEGEAKREVLELVKDLQLKALELAPPDKVIGSRYNLAVTHRKLGENEFFKSQMNIIIDTGADERWAAYRELAYAALEDGAPENVALQIIIKALRLKPDDPESVVLFSAARAKGEADPAQLPPTDEVHFDPVYIEVWKGIGSVYLKRSRFDKARLCYRKVVRLSPDNIEGVRALGQLARLEAEILESEK